MSTRSYIGIRNEDGSISYCYCHWDGYPEYNGALLQKYYDSKEKVEELLKHGDISSLEETIETCTFYHRDRGEELRANCKAASIEDAVSFSDVEYMYVYEREGFWNCSDIGWKDFDDPEYNQNHVYVRWTKPLLEVLDELGVFD